MGPVGMYLCNCLAEAPYRVAARHRFTDRLRLPTRKRTLIRDKNRTFLLTKCKTIDYQVVTIEFIKISHRMVSISRIVLWSRLEKVARRFGEDWCSQRNLDPGRRKPHGSIGRCDKRWRGTSRRWGGSATSCPILPRRPWLNWKPPNARCGSPRRNATLSAHAADFQSRSRSSCRGDECVSPLLAPESSASRNAVACWRMSARPVSVIPPSDR